MKKIIFLFHFLVLTNAFISFAQTPNYSITAPTSITVCGSRQTITIDISATSALVDHTFVVDFDLSGMRIYNPRTTDELSFPGFTEGASLLTVNAPNLSGNTSLQFDLWVGCNVPIESYPSLSANIQVKDAGIASVKDILVLKTTNGSLLPPMSDLSWVQKGGIGSTVSRSFVYENTTSNPFTGFINFNDVFELPNNSALSIESIEILFADNHIQTITNNTTVELERAVLPGQQMIVTEKVKMIKCVQEAKQGWSSVTIATGCSVDELCYGDDPFDLIVEEPEGISNVQPTDGFVRSLDYFVCFDESAFQEAYHDFTNIGTAPANGIKFTFIPATQYVTDKNSFIVEIIDAIGNVKSEGYVLLNHPRLAGETNIYGYDNQNNESGSFSHYRDIFLDNSFPQFNQFSNCGINEYLMSVVISNYVDGNGEQQSINLLPGEKARLKWKDKHCCFNTDVTYDVRMYKPLIRSFLIDCSGPVKNTSSIFKYSYRDFSQNVLPYNPSLNGNPDKNMLTNDGDTRIINLQNKVAFYGNLPDEVSQWGDLVIDLTIENGADLDLTLNGTAPLENGDTERYHIKFIDDASEVELPLSIIPNKINTSSTGVTYRIVVSYQDLYNISQHQHSNPDVRKDIVARFLAQTRIQFKVKSYCPAPPVTHVFEKIYYRPNQTLCNSECLMLLYKKDLELTIVCPGCITPGGNVLSSTLEREFPGLKDDNNDGIPDNTGVITDALLKVNCTNGDPLIGLATVFLSDGDVGGFTLNNLTARNIFIKKMFLKIAPNQPGILELASNTAEVSIDNTTWKPVTINQTTLGEFIAEVDYSILDLPSDKSFNDYAGMNIYVRYRLEVISNDLINDEPVKPSQLVYITTHAYYTDCTNCIDPVSQNWTFVNADDATNVVCNWSDVNETCSLSNKFYWCSSNQNLINYIPIHTITRKSSGIPNSCNPSTIMHFGVKAFSVNSFSKEYRTFIDNGSQKTLTFSIPPGFRVNSLHVNNFVNPSYTVSPRSYDSYSLVTHQAILNAQNSGILTITSDNKLILPLTYEVLNGNNSDADRYGTYTGQAIRVADDALYTNVELVFEPIDCNTMPFESVISDSGYPINSPYTLLEGPTISLPDLPNSSSGVKSIPTHNISLMPFHRPDTRLEGTAPSSVYPDQNYYFIPVVLDNLAPLNSNGEPVRDIMNNALGSIQAKFPFLYVKNLSSLPLIGISIEGVYEGVVDRESMTSSVNFYNSATGIASLKKDGLDYIPANSTNNKYTLVIKYTCPAGCDPVLPECTTSDQGDQLSPCLTTVKQLLLNYGWDCNKYPQTASEVLQVCDLKELSPITVNTPSVALEITPTLNNNNPIVQCQNFEYKLLVKSCKNGNIDRLDVAINLPSNVEFVSSALPTTNTSNMITINDVTGGGVFNIGMEKTIVVLLRLKDVESTTVEISSTVNGVSYCASTFSRTRTVTAPVQSTIIGINATGVYCLNSTPVDITTTVSPGVFTSLTGLTDNGDGTATFAPSVAGIGTYTIIYTANTPEGCIGTATKTIEVISTPVVTTNIPSVQCVGSGPLVLSSNPSGAVFSGMGVTLNNSVYQFHGDETGLFDIQYVYTSIDGCVASGEKTIQVDDFTISIDTQGLACIGESVSLTAKVNGSVSGNLTYTWNKIVNNSPIYLSGPTTNNVYSYTNYSATTNFQATASNGYCTVVSNQLTVNPTSADECCIYKLGDITVNCSTSLQDICIPLMAVRNVHSGIIGMDFCLKYDPTVLKYNGPFGTLTSSTLGTVVTNAGLFGANYAAYNDETNGVLRVSIYYTGEGQTETVRASFAGTGEIICLNFSVLPSLTLQGNYPIAMCAIDELQEAYTLEEKAACWKPGSLTIQIADDAKGRLENPLYGNAISGSALVPGDPAVATTEVSIVDGNCDPVNSQLSTRLIGSTFSMPANGGTKIKITRDVHAEYSPSRQEYQLIVNGSDTWKIHRITTMDPVLNDNNESDEQRNLNWYAIAAADVNMNGRIRANDISLLQERISAKRDYFPQVWNGGMASTSLDWRFVDQTTVLSNASFKKSINYPNPDGFGFYRENVPNIPFCLDVRNSCDGETPELYYGIMLGDVYKSSTGERPGTNVYLRTSSEKSSITVDTRHAQYLGDNIYRIPVIHKYAYEYSDKLFAIDMYMDYNSQKIRVNNVLYTTVTTNGGVNMMWNNADEEEFILTSYATLDSIESTGVSYYFDIEKYTDEPFRKADFGTLQFLLNGELVEARVETGETTGVNNGESSIKPHITIIPNPASGVAMIDFAVSNNSNDNRIIITDVLGRVVRVFEHVQNFGMLNFNTEDLAPGMYIISIKGDNGFGLSEKFQVRK